MLQCPLFAVSRVLVVAVFLVALSVAAPAAGAQSRNRWPAVQEQSFLVNCEATSGGKTTECKCALTWLERRYTYRQIASLYLHDQPRLRPILLRAVAIGRSASERERSWTRCHLRRGLRQKG